MHRFDYKICHLTQVLVCNRFKAHIAEVSDFRSCSEEPTRGGIQRYTVGGVYRSDDILEKNLITFHESAFYYTNRSEVLR